MLFRSALALGAMPIATAIVGDERVPARRVLTARDMAAEGCGPAALDRTHHLQLADVHVATVGVTPSGTVVAEDIRDLQMGASHGPPLLGRRLVLLGPQRGEPVERAHHLADDVGGDLRVACRRF